MNSEIATVIIPVRDRADHLKNCLETLAKQDSAIQRMPILICDDGSKTDIGKVVECHNYGLKGLKLLRQSAKGPAAARNLGIANSKSEIVVLLDSDVIPGANAISLLVQALAQNPKWIGAEARIRPFGGKDGPLWDAPVSEGGGRYLTAAIAYRRDALVAAGGLDETFMLASCEDLEIAARLLPHGTIGFVPESVVLHPRRRVTLRTYWSTRRHWRYVMILAKRYGFLGFPENPSGRCPRLRVALAAVVTLPGGRFLQGLKHFKRQPFEGVLACTYAMFDVLFGMFSLPVILFGSVPHRLDYLRVEPAEALSDTAQEVKREVTGNAR
jgi:GT2 family glycosyltransferase